MLKGIGHMFKEVEKASSKNESWIKTWAQRGVEPSLRQLKEVRNETSEASQYCPISLGGEGEGILSIVHQNTM